MRSNRPAPREVELKLTVPDGSGALLSRLLQARAQHEPERRHEVTTYYDTADRALASTGLSLRVRSAGNGYIQTVKASDRKAVAADRAEWEWSVGGERPDTSLVQETPVAAILADGAQVAPAFRTEIDRAAWRLELDCAEVEAALDEGQIVAGQAAHAVRDLELELREGDPAVLFRLALALHTAVPLQVEPLSKAARGWLLTDDEPPPTAKADTLDLTAGVPAGVAFREIVAAELGHLLANRPAA